MMMTVHSKQGAFEMDKQNIKRGVGGEGGVQRVLDGERRYPSKSDEDTEICLFGGFSLISSEVKTNPNSGAG